LIQRVPRFNLHRTLFFVVYVQTFINSRKQKAQKGRCRNGISPLYEAGIT